MTARGEGRVSAAGQILRLSHCRGRLRALALRTLFALNFYDCGESLRDRRRLDRREDIPDAPLGRNLVGRARTVP